MKFRHFFVLIALMIMVFACGSKSQDSSKQKAPEVIKTVELQVEGMTCTGCENTIQKSVGSLPGVKTVKADHVAGNAVITYDSASVSMEAMTKAVTDKGYEVTGVNNQ